MSESILLEPGQRGLLAGQTGSGKTQNAIWQLRNTEIFPRFILDTKIEDAFFGLPEGDETLKLIESHDELLQLKKVPDDEWPDYVLIRPNTSHLTDPEILDTYLHLLYENFGHCFIYIDELYMFHTSAGRCGAGLIGLLTRGRSRGKTVLQSTQRPAYISRFCFTESNRFYVHKLLDKRDRKTFDMMIPSFSEQPIPPKYHFYYFDSAIDDAPRLYAPVPYQQLNPKKIKFSKKTWI